MADPLIINNWQSGVADSPHLGFGLMRNVDIELFPGAIKTGKLPQSVFHTAFSTTFTADAATDTLTISSPLNPATRLAVTVSSSGTLPAGLSPSTNYFVINVSTTTFKLATTIANASAGTAINITDAGTGTHTVTTVDPGTIMHIIENARTGVLFAQDSNARVWYNELGTFRLLNGNTLTSGVGNGIVVFENSDKSAEYLLAFRNQNIDIVNVTGTANLEAPSWTNSWNFGGAVADTTLNSAVGSGNSHHVIVAQDNIIYFCDDRYVGTIREIGIFDPANTATYTGNDQALDMPQLEVNQWLEELGVKLFIAGGTFNKIYPWDRTSSSFDLPIPVPENSIKRLKNIGNVIYILAGIRGNIYTTQGSFVTLLRSLPGYMINNSSTIPTQVTWGGIAQVNGALLFGAGVNTTANSGLYLLYPNGILIMRNVPPTGASNVTAIFSEGEQFTFGYSGGAANFANAARYSSFEAVVNSELYKVGIKSQKATYSTLELQLAKPAASGHARISYRADISSSFTTIDTYTADGVATSFETDAGLIDLENIEVQMEMDGEMEVVEIRFIP